MSTTDVEICSRSLAELGDEPILSLDDPSKRARFCKQLYPNVRDEVLCDAPWNCATKRVALALSVTPPAWGFTNRFQLPSDYLNFVSIEHPLTPWRREEDSILSHDSEMNLVYVFRLVDVSRMDPLLQDALVMKLAAALVGPLSRDASRRTQLEALYQERLSKAQIRDAKEAPVEQLISSTWINAHLGANDEFFRGIEHVP